MRCVEPTWIAAPARSNLMGVSEKLTAAQASGLGAGVISPPHALITSHRDLIIAAAPRHRVPIVAWPKAGGLID